jgi:hypothetical protein
MDFKIQDLFSIALTVISEKYLAWEHLHNSRINPDGMSEV